MVQSEFYDNQRAEIVEDTFHKAVLKKSGTFDRAYLDNGKQYITKSLEESCAKLGIRLLHAKPYECQAKGKIEVFHKSVDRFIAEIRVAHIHSVAELNERWKVFLEMDYEKKAHSGIAEYYASMGVEVPEGGITPLQEWNRDERPLRFIDVNTVAEAFYGITKRDRSMKQAVSACTEGRMKPVQRRQTWRWRSPMTHSEHGDCEDISSGNDTGGRPSSPDRRPR